MSTKSQKGQVNFALFTDHPIKKNRTLDWDQDESGFNETEDANFLAQQGYSNFTRDNTGYYTSNKGRYFPGIIYYKPGTSNTQHFGIRGGGYQTRGGTWKDAPNTLYQFDDSGNSQKIDMTNLTEEQYNLIKNNLQLDLSKFYNASDNLDEYVPNKAIQFPTTRNFGNVKVTYLRENDRQPNKYNYNNWLEGFSGKKIGEDGNSWEVVDPDKGYNFKIYQMPTRQGASLQFEGTYPKELEEYNGKNYYDQWGDGNEDYVGRKTAINRILQPYGFTFKNGGLINYFKFFK